MDDWEVPPLRPLNDFLLKSARFSLPAINDPSRWANRVISNLVYYQANYILSAALLFRTMTLEAMLMGLLTMVVIFAIFIYTTSNRVEMHRFKRNHPFVYFLLILLCCVLLPKVFVELLVFMWGNTLSLAMIFTHASLRRRNFQNRMHMRMELMGLKRTPMGILLCHHFERGRVLLVTVTTTVVLLAFVAR